MHGGKLRQSRVEPGQPSNIPAFHHQIPHPISHVLATVGPQRVQQPQEEFWAHSGCSSRQAKLLQLFVPCT